MREISGGRRWFGSGAMYDKTDPRPHVLAKTAGASLTYWIKMVKRGSIDAMNIVKGFYSYSIFLYLRPFKKPSKGQSGPVVQWIE